MPKDRISQVNELMKQELANIVMREIEIPDGTVLTITRVEATPNLQQARVYISVVPDEQGKEVVKILQRNIYSIQQLVNERLHMRPVPRIQWTLETSAIQTQRVEQLLDQIRKEG